MPLHKWRSEGSFRVPSCDKSGIVIETASAEIGEALWADAEHLLNHAAEQRVALLNSVSTGGWVSPAWTFVTIYYWAFFSAVAITRMAGDTIWRLDGGALEEFKRLASSADKPASGAMKVSLEPISATDCRAKLAPTGLRFHEAIWKKAHQTIRELAEIAKKQSRESLDARLWQTLKRAADLLGDDWPSRTRNQINYVPGYAYCEVTQTTWLSLSEIRRLRFDRFEDLLVELEFRVEKIKNNGKQRKDGDQSIPLYLIAIAFHSISQTLHADIISRTQGDSRWAKMRDLFASKTSTFEI